MEKVFYSEHKCYFLNLLRGIALPCPNMPLFFSLLHFLLQVSRYKGTLHWTDYKQYPYSPTTINTHTFCVFLLFFFFCCTILSELLLSVFLAWAVHGGGCRQVDCSVHTTYTVLLCKRGWLCSYNQWEHGSKCSHLLTGLQTNNLGET